jgi:galactokinase
MTIVCATNEGLYATCSYYKPNMILYEHNNTTFEFILDRSILTPIASEGGFYSYVAGTILSLLDNNEYLDKLQTQGLHINNYKTTLPMKKGLSSSAAICVLITKCFNEIYNIGMDISTIMDIAYHGEMYTPSKCGRMDQCVAMGKNQIGLMKFNSKQCTLHIINCKRDLHFVVCNLNGYKDTVQILSDLNACFPIPTTNTQVCII